MSRVLGLHVLSAMTEHEFHTSTEVENDEDPIGKVLRLHACGQVDVSAMTEDDCHTSTTVDDDNTMCRVLRLHACVLADVSAMTDHNIVTPLPRWRMTTAPCSGALDCMLASKLTC